jgi:hypothetical protein
MTDAFKCDRCNEYETGEPAGQMVKFGGAGVGGSDKETDLCSSCASEVLSTIQNYEE